jgi:hypothetical protein
MNGYVLVDKDWYRILNPDLNQKYTTETILTPITFVNSTEDRMQQLAKGFPFHKNEKFVVAVTDKNLIKELNFQLKYSKVFSLSELEVDAVKSSNDFLDLRLVVSVIGDEMRQKAKKCNDKLADYTFECKCVGQSGDTKHFLVFPVKQ